MKTGLHNITQQTQQIYQNHFLPFLKAETDKISHFLDSLEKILKKYERARKKAEKEKDTLKLQQAQKELMLGLYTLNEACFSLSEGQDFDLVFSGLEEEMEAMLHSITKEKDLQQKGEHFKIQEGDSGKTKLLKRLKSIGISFNRAALKLENFFRKLMKKPEKSFRKWRRVIPLRGYTEQTLKIDTLDKLFALYEEIMKVYAKDVNTFNEISESFKNLFELIQEEQTSEPNESGASRALSFISDYKKDLEQLLVSLREQADQILVDSIDQYVNSYNKIGTVELPARNFSPAKIEAHSKAQQKSFNRLTRGWENTLFALSEDWKMDLEIYILSFTTQISDEHFLQTSGKQFYAHTEKQSKLMVKAVDTLRTSIAKNRGAAEETISFLEGIRTKLTKVLSNELIPDISNHLTEQNLPLQIEGIEKKVLNSVDKISNKRILVRNLDIEKPVKSSDLTTVSPQELIRFETLPKFERQVTDIKAYLSKSVNDLHSSFQEVHQIADYNIDTAITLLDSKDVTATQARKTAEEGLERTITKLNIIIEASETAHGWLEETMTGLTTDLTASLLRLTNTENIFEIRLRIAKAKAIKRSEEYRKNAREKTKTYFRLLRKKVVHLITTGTTYKEQLSRMYSLGNEMEEISAEFSSFLAETRTAINRLPFVYQRLFRLEPTTDINLFNARKQELKTMNGAYENWQKERFAPVALVGEKGAGMTSLIHYFVNEKNLDVVWLDYPDEESDSGPELLLNIFRKNLEDDSIADFEQLTEKLLSEKSRRVFILEGLQFLFLRKVDGFESLKKLIRLISDTQKEVFWITSCTLYAWQYLIKTMQINEYFGYTVTLGELSDKEMVELIQKRHKVSGYNLEFVPSASELESSKFQKMDQSEKQQYLEKEYYTELNKFAKGNISIAIMFWMRSTLEIKDSTILIGSMKNYDFRFIKSLSTDKLFLLHALLLHDGLTVKQYHDVMNISLEKGRMQLLQMADDGILLEFSGYYVINLLLYRQIINLFKSKNLLH